MNSEPPISPRCTASSTVSEPPKAIHGLEYMPRSLMHIEYDRNHKLGDQADEHASIEQLVVVQREHVVHVRLFPALQAPNETSKSLQA